MGQQITEGKGHKARKIILRTLAVLGVLVLLVLSFAAFSYFHLKSFFTTPERVDDRGRLYYTEYTGERTSLTQYSAIYDNANRCLDLCVYPDYSKVYHYDIE